MELSHNQAKRKVSFFRVEALSAKSVAYLPTTHFGTKAALLSFSVVAHKIF